VVLVIGILKKSGSGRPDLIPTLQAVAFLIAAKFRITLSKQLVSIMKSLMNRDSDKIEEMFVHLVANHQIELRAFVVSMMPGSAEVDDVIQSTNLVVWQKRGEFEIGTSFKAWMFSVAKFQVMAAWRDQKRRKEWALPESVLTKLIEEGVASGSEAIVPRHEILHECLQQLRPEDRGLILRRYFDGRRVKDVAAEAGRGVDSVKMSLHRIRLMLGMCVRRIQCAREKEVLP
jgi:RNA polymerase sigma-70 factor (ECF subfamily)